MYTLAANLVEIPGVPVWSLPIVLPSEVSRRTQVGDYAFMFTFAISL